MSNKFFKKWTAIIIVWILFCIFQMFFSNISRFTIACAYFTNATLMIFIWLHGWEAYKLNKAKVKKPVKNTLLVNDIILKTSLMEFSNNLTFAKTAKEHLEKDKC